MLLSFPKARMVSAAPKSSVTIFLGLVGTFTSPFAVLTVTSLEADEEFVVFELDCLLSLQAASSTTATAAKRDRSSVFVFFFIKIPPKLIFIGKYKLFYH